MQQVFSSLKSMVSDDTGSVSSVRVAFLFVVVAVLLPPVVAAIKTGQHLTLTNTDLQLLAGAAGVKLWQNSQENSTPTPNKP